MHIKIRIYCIIKILNNYSKTRINDDNPHTSCWNDEFKHEIAILLLTMSVKCNILLTQGLAQK